jgi:hypothetical protein
VIYFETLGSISDFAPELLVGQDIAGNWQGTLKFGKIESRLVVTISA